MTQEAANEFMRELVAMARSQAVASGEKTLATLKEQRAQAAASLEVLDRFIVEQSQLLEIAKNPFMPDAAIEAQLDRVRDALKAWVEIRQ